MEMGYTADEFGKSQNDEDYLPIDPTDSTSIKKSALLKYWYVVKMYRSLFFVFREPEDQLEKWNSKLLRTSTRSASTSAMAKLTMWEGGRRGVKRALGKHHSSIKKIWTTFNYEQNEAQNSNSDKVMVHILHVLDNASTAYTP